MSSERTDLEGLTDASQSRVGDASPRTLAHRRERGRLIVAAVIAAVVTVFALVNLGDVKVHWVLASGRTPLIVVIALAFLLGMIVDRLVIRARRKRSG